MRVSRVARSLAVAFTLASVPVLSPAAVVTVEFSGIVRPEYFALPASLAGQVQPGSLVTGSYRYDDSQPDASPAADAGSYSFESPYFLSMTLGTLHVGTENANVSPRFWIGIGNDFTDGTLPPSDSYTVSAIAPNVVPGFPLDIGLQLLDSTATALSSDALPTALPSLGTFDTRAGFLLDPSSGGALYMSFDVTEWHVPEPSLLALVAASAAALLGLRSRR